MAKAFPYLVQALHAAFLNVVNVEQMPPKRALDWGAVFVLPQGKDGFRQLGQQPNIIADHSPEIDTCQVHFRDFLGNGGEIAAFGKRFMGPFGDVFIGDDYLQDPARFLGGEFIQAGIVSPGDFLIHYGDFGGNFVDFKPYDC